MPTDLQLIDGLEALRRAFLLANPDFVAPVVARAEPEETPAGRVAAAWLEVCSGAAARNPEGRRHLRAATRTLLAGEGALPPPRGAGTGKLTPHRWAEWCARFPAALERAARRRLWPLEPEPPARSLAEEAAAWSAALPGLTPGRGWRLLRRLGRPVLGGDREALRCLVRLGVLPPTTRDPAALQSEFERWQRLTGLAPDMLLQLIDWLLGRTGGWQGGAWCVRQPHCPTCPLQAHGCAHARLHAAQPDRHAGRAAAHAELAGWQARVAQGRAAELEEVELLALLLAGAGQPPPVRAAAERLLATHHSLAGLERAAVPELAAGRGLNARRAVLLKAALELGRRLAAAGLRPGEPITSSAAVFRAYRARFSHLPQEYFVVLLLDAKHRVLGEHIVSKGTLTGSLAHPREVFHAAVRHSAAGVILLHNHPSGDPTPSAEDRALTRRLKEAGELMGIKVLDHIILGAERHYSFADEE